MLPVPVEAPFEVLDISGKEHFLLTLRLLCDPASYVVVAFGDNFMGNLGVGSDDEVGDHVHVVLTSTHRPTVCSGFRHTMALVSE